MTWAEFKTCVRADLYREEGRKGFATLLRSLWGWPGFRYLFFFRLCQFTKRHALLKFCAYPFARLLYLRTGMKFGIRIPLNCEVGSGLYIGHWGGIWVNPGVRIGRNCVLGHEVTLGHVSRGPTRGVPEIGDCVYLGPGAKILGKVRIANHALVSANSLVLQDVPEKGVVIGVPARVFSQTGSEGYVTWTYEEEPRAEIKTASPAA